MPSDSTQAPAPTPSTTNSNQPTQKPNRDENDPLFQFNFEDVKRKVREAEQYTDQDDFDASVGILKRCMDLFDAKFGNDWIDRFEAGEPMNIEDVLFYARLLKEFGINCLYYERLNDELGVEIDPETGRPAGVDGGDGDGDGDGDADDNNAGDDANATDDGATTTTTTNTTPNDTAGVDDDSDGEDLSGDDETYLSQAVANLTLSCHLFSKYINERAVNLENDQISISRPIQDEHGNETQKLYILGNKSSYPRSGTDMVDQLNDGQLDITRVEICQTYLCDVYETLAEIYCEEERWQDAQFFLKIALALRQKVEKVDGRGLASAHSKYASYFFHNNQYEGSNYHYIRAASVFVNRIGSRLQQLHESVPEVIREKVPLVDIPRSTDTSDDGLYIPRSQGDKVVECYRDLYKAILHMYGDSVQKEEDIADDTIRGHVLKIKDYIDIYTVLMERYDDNLQDIAEQKAYEKKRDREGKGRGSKPSAYASDTTSSTSSTTDHVSDLLSPSAQPTQSIDETQRVKAMVQEVMRTDQIVKTRDPNEALGFGSSKSKFGSSLSSGSTPTEATEVNVLTVKRKTPPSSTATPTPVAKPSTAPVAATAAAEGQEVSSTTTSTSTSTTPTTTTTTTATAAPSIPENTPTDQTTTGDDIDAPLPGEVNQKKQRIE